MDSVYTLKSLSATYKIDLHEVENFSHRMRMHGLDVYYDVEINLRSGKCLKFNDLDYVTILSIGRAIDSAKASKHNHVIL